jgi:predicted RNA binding protein YcfA (HicA-like mRNA interferase family)
MKQLSGKDVCLILSKHGFVKVRQKGSHQIMQKVIANSTITIPVPLHKEIKIGTLHSIIRQSQLSKQDFE